MSQNEVTTQDFSQNRLERLDSALLQRKPPTQQMEDSDFRSCESCGSKFFYIVNMIQLKPGDYSSTPGGDLSQAGAHQFDVAICACGRPQESKIGGALRTGRSANLGMSEFQRSIGSAIEAFDRTRRLDQEKVQRIVAPMIAPLITPEEVDEKIAAATGNQIAPTPAKRK